MPEFETNDIKEMKYRVSVLHNALNLNKTKNLAIDAIKLLAFLVIVSKKKNTIILDYKTDSWLSQNFTEKRFEKCLAIFKIFDIIMLLNYDEHIFKVNWSCLKKVISRKLFIKDLIEIDDYAIKKYKGIAKKEKFKQGDTNLDNASSDFLQAAQRIRKLKSPKRLDSRDSFEKFKFNPSENPKLRTWKSRDVTQWRSIDFLGYYFSCYKDATGYENVSFQTEQTYIKVKNSIRDLLRDWFHDDKATYKKYIEWVVSYLHNSDWKGHNCGVVQVFPYKAKTYILDSFVKENGKKTIVKGTRRKVDNELADNKSWSDDGI